MFLILYILSKRTLVTAGQPERFAQKDSAVAQPSAPQRHSDSRPRERKLNVAESAPQFRENMIKYKK